MDSFPVAGSWVGGIPAREDEWRESEIIFEREEVASLRG